MSVTVEVGSAGLDDVQAFAARVVDELAAAASTALVVLGDRLGMYRSMAGAGALSPPELAARVGCAERYVREWLANQAAGGYVVFDPDSGRFTLPDAHAAVLAEEGGPAFLLGSAQATVALYAGLDGLAAVFRSGAGIAWDEQPEDLHEGCARLSRVAIEPYLPGWIAAVGDPPGGGCRWSDRRSRMRSRLGRPAVGQDVSQRSGGRGGQLGARDRRRPTGRPGGRAGRTGELSPQRVCPWRGGRSAPTTCRWWVRSTGSSPGRCSSAPEQSQLNGGPVRSTRGALPVFPPVGFPEPPPAPAVPVSEQRALHKPRYGSCGSSSRDRPRSRDRCFPGIGTVSCASSPGAGRATGAACVATPAAPGAAVRAAACSGR